jgi:macrolide transport system ATP-binding/permease protein
MLQDLRYRMRALFKRKAMETELTEELRFHFDHHVDKNMKLGMPYEQAMRSARLHFGGMDQVKEACRDARGLSLLDRTLQDFRFATRQLRRNRGFATTAILTLALGICATVSIFAFVDAALIQPLPYGHATRLVALFERTPSGARYHLSYPDYLDWKRLNTAFTRLEAYDGGGFFIDTPVGQQHVDGATVSAGFFRTLEVNPILGRDFLSNEDQPQAARSALLSYSSWQTRFGRRKDIVGQVVTLDKIPFTIVGVLPPHFHFAPVGSPEFWVAMHFSTSEDRGAHGLSAIARLKDGVSLDAAHSDLELIANRLAKEYPDADQGRGSTVVSLSELIFGSIRPIMLVLLCGAGLLYLIACVNVASLLLVRTEVRKREIALRGALGASRLHLVRQFLMEGLLLTGIGSLLGLAIAGLGIGQLTRLIPPGIMAGMPYLAGLGMSRHLVYFSAGISIAAALIFSAVPILRLPADGNPAGLNESGRYSSGTFWHRAGTHLVVIELATAMVLMVGAGLLAKSFYRLLQAETGIKPDHVETLRVSLPRSAYSKPQQLIAMVHLILERAGSLPGVESASVAHNLPIGALGGNTTFVVVGRPPTPTTNEVNQRQVSPRYFSTLKARLRRGRFFTADEDASKPAVAIINETMAKLYFNGEDPTANRLAYGITEPAIQIVGVVSDVREGPLDQAVRPAMYIPFDQDPDSSFFLLLRSSQAEESAISMVSNVIHTINPEIVTSEGQSMTERIHDSPSAYLHRSSAWLVSAFAALALFLGSVGMYGVLAYSVGQRTREIGVRMALGAQRASVYRLVLTEAGWLAAAGILLGSICSIVTATLMRSLLFGVESWDLPTIGMVAAVLSIATTLASYVPARRAASVNPVEALSAE